MWHQAQWPSQDRAYLCGDKYDSQRIDLGCHWCGDSFASISSRCMRLWCILSVYICSPGQRERIMSPQPLIKPFKCTWCLAHFTRKEHQIRHEQSREQPRILSRAPEEIADFDMIRRHLQTSPHVAFNAVTVHGCLYASTRVPHFHAYYIRSHFLERYP
ncbi:Zinc finger C2H2-type/integrase DNA-binding protein [Macrophomina phaseolina MS6]|uniref:Zinc finger C2H2-type/integrase DNA-binding protein n=1 Tax=Macrophomina phaseolina (strain MS6) TaxID=1126212 RepID=K2RH32_MACPH|nr:Zinc finger C2H2-type/integrase DNA-binding protein [Macrophomina phaseolina MS6]